MLRKSLRSFDPILRGLGEGWDDIEAEAIKLGYGIRCKKFNRDLSIKISKPDKQERYLLITIYKSKKNRIQGCVLVGKYKYGTDDETEFEHIEGPNLLSKVVKLKERLKVLL